MPTKHFDDLTVHEKRRLVFLAALRTIVTVAVVVAVYFLAPMDRAMTTATVVELVLGALVFCCHRLADQANNRIQTSRHPRC
jgi:voltage-gated potassium channel